MNTQCALGDQGRRHITCEGAMYYRDGRFYCSGHYRAKFAFAFDDASQYEVSA